MTPQIPRDPLFSCRNLIQKASGSAVVVFKEGELEHVTSKAVVSGKQSLEERESLMAARHVFYNSIAKELAQYGASAEEINNLLASKVLASKALSVREVKRELKALDRYAERSACAKKMHIPAGLKALTGHKALEKRISEQDLGQPYVERARIGPWTAIAAKEKGVEPGFVGTKAFTEKDWEKLVQDPSSKQRQAAIQCLKAAKDHPKGRLYKQLSAWLKREQDKGNAWIKRSNPTLSTEKLIDHLLGNPQVFTNFLQPLSSRSLGVVGQLKRDIREVMPKYQKKRYVKLDYKEADTVTVADTTYVMVPKGKKGLLHRIGTVKTREQANTNAMREALANDLMAPFALTQKLEIHEGKYADGYPKLLLEGTHLESPQRESFEDFSRHIVDGYLVQESADQRRPGKPLTSDNRVTLLGMFKILFLLMGDRDAIGSRGDNKGRVGNTFAAIDPGHSLEAAPSAVEGLVKTDLMTFENIHNDFSFDQPARAKDKLEGGYKNFTLFDDRPFLEKMEGVKKLKELKDQGTFAEIFAAYRKQFSKPPLDFRADIDAMEERFNKRLDYILGVFEHRLAFMDTSVDQKALTALDRLEKITSSVSEFSPRRAVKLNYLRVTDRIPWDITRTEEGNILFSSTGPKAGQAKDRLSAFINSHPEIAFPGGVLIETSENAVNLTIPPNQIDWLESLLGEDESAARAFHGLA